MSRVLNSWVNKAVPLHLDASRSPRVLREGEQHTLLPAPRAGAGPRTCLNRTGLSSWDLLGAGSVELEVALTVPHPPYGDFMKVLNTL